MVDRAASGYSSSVPEMSAPPDPAHPDPTDLPQPGLGWQPGVTTLTRMGIAALVGVLVGIGVTVGESWTMGVLLGWMAAGAVFVTWMWISIWPMVTRRSSRSWSETSNRSRRRSSPVRSRRPGGSISSAVR
jgi:hypothetical protein